MQDQLKTHQMLFEGKILGHPQEEGGWATLKSNYIFWDVYGPSMTILLLEALIGHIKKGGWAILKSFFASNYNNKNLINALLCHF